MEILKDGKMETLDYGNMERLKHGTIALAVRGRRSRDPETPVLWGGSGVRTVRKRRLRGLFTVVDRTDNVRGSGG